MYWIAFGDIHEDLRALPRLRNESLGAEAVFLVGDLSDGETSMHAEAVLEAVEVKAKKVYAFAGNMDAVGFSDFLHKAGKTMHKQVFVIGDEDTAIQVAGVGFSTTTPFNTPGEVTEEEMGQWLETMKRQINPAQPLIFFSHNPPFDTKLDALSDGTHVGSPAVRDFIETMHPDICVFGHIHESKGEDVLGKSKMFNSGAFSEGGYVRINYVDGILSAELKNL